MATIAIMNQKGGCGKTTTSINLAAALSSKQKKVLLIDFDPQGHSSLGVNVKIKNSPKTIFHVLVENLPLVEAIHPVAENFDIIPCNILLSSIEQSLAGTFRREFRLKDIVIKLENKYDFVILDCPPSLGLLSINAIMASSHIIVPVEPSKFALDGVYQFSETIKVLSNKVGHELKVKQLISIYDLESHFAHEFIKEIKDTLNNTLFNTHVHKSNLIREASYHGQSIIEYNPDSLGYVDFMSLAHEVLIWINQEKIQVVLDYPNRGPQVTTDGVYFFHESPQAKVVQLAGTFNNWDPEKSYMERLENSDYWYSIVPLPQGSYKYKFVVDGKYVDDPNNPHKDISMFGVSQSIIKVG